MKSLKKNLRIIVVILCVMFICLGVYFAYALTTYGTRWLNSPYNVRLQNQKNAVIAGTIYDRNHTVLASSNEEGERSYASSKSVRRALSHTVGDNYGLTSSGAENFFANYLLGMESSVFERIYKSFTGEKQKGTNIVLTVDAQLCTAVYEALGSYRGGAVVMNYKTGEILATVSQPGFDPENMGSYLPESQGGTGDAEDNGSLVNRVTAGQYTPGSVFKIITAAAAIRYLPGIDTRTFDCDGPLVFDEKSEKYLENIHISPEEDKANREADQSESSPDAEDDVYEETGEGYKVLRDYQSSYHGEITFAQAFAKSCNTTFARLGMEIGYSRLAKMASDFGIGTDFSFGDIMIYTSKYQKPESDYQLAWSAVGQYKDIMVPMQLCMISGAIANGGAMMEPRLLRATEGSAGYGMNYTKSSVYSNPLTPEEAERMQELMVGVVKSGTGSSAAIKGMTVGGKTGTAEVSDDKSVAAHAWFTGFILDEDHPLCVAVILEKGGSGGGKAAPIAKEILQKAIKLGY